MQSVEEKGGCSLSQRLQEMRQATADRTRGERERKERRRQEKEWARLNAQ
jgi:hypothetical protein